MYHIALLQGRRETGMRRGELRTGLRGRRRGTRGKPRSGCRRGDGSGSIFRTSCDSSGRVSTAWTPALGLPPCPRAPSSSTKRLFRLRALRAPSGTPPSPSGGARRGLAPLAGRDPQLWRLKRPQHLLHASKLLEAHPAKVAERRCLDLSAGCGIVAIVMAALGATSVVASDLGDNLTLLRYVAAVCGQYLSS